MAAPLQKNLSRRASFNEATMAKSQDHYRKPPSEPEFIDTEAQPIRKPLFRACFNTCCAWASMIVAVLLLIALITGGVYFAFLQSNLPEVRLQRLDVYNLQVNSTSTNTFLTTDFEVTLNVTNHNDKIELSYSPMTASLSSEGINLGSVKLPAMTQRSRSSTSVKVRAAIKRTAVDETAAQDLQDNSSKHMMAIGVVVNGRIDFVLNDRKMNGFPFRVLYRSIEQSDIDNGYSPKCSIQMNPL